MKASQALSSALVFEDLLKRLMTIVLESAGAERGVRGDREVDDDQGGDRGAGGGLHPFAGAPFDPFDVKSLNLMDAFTPPAWSEGGMAKHPLGTDNQGRDMLSAILYGCRMSLMIGLAAIVLSVTTGVLLGLLAGFRGGCSNSADTGDRGAASSAGDPAGGTGD